MTVLKGAVLSHRCADYTEGCSPVTPLCRLYWRVQSCYTTVRTVVKGAVLSHLCVDCSEGCSPVTPLCSPVTLLCRPQHSNINMRFSLPWTCLQNSLICFSNFVVHSFVEVLRFPLIHVFSPKCDASVRFPPVLWVARVSLQQQTALTTGQTSLTVPRFLKPICEGAVVVYRAAVWQADTARCLLALVYEFPATKSLWPPHHLCPLYKNVT